MTDRTCAACDIPVKDTDTICSRCERQTVAHLADQAAHYEDLLTTLTGMVNVNAPNDGGKGANPHIAWPAMGERYLDSITPDELRRFSGPARAAAEALHLQ